MNALRKSLLSLLESSRNTFQLPLPIPALNFAALAANPDSRSQPSASFLDDLKEGLLRAVQTNRRSVQRRQWRRIGMPQFNSKPRRDLKVCIACGNLHEAHTLCGHCYASVRAETEVVKEAMSKTYGHLKPIEHEVVVVYEGEAKPKDRPEKIIEIPKKRPDFFAKNLLEKENVA
ncbi:39S ribosomal protein L32, mitochondrial [Galendromus occidentalis]|uniref:Large ribosomal subunit protein bL32m n=1 Tax=Galendromus occidentalis TaxID=34638 RepID=A0AAJ6QPR2_9ACAR|nr:39S ribosomal protein L32, mitochondrial [Galendromus occidentalis]